VVTTETTIRNRREDLARVARIVDELARRHHAGDDAIEAEVVDDGGLFDPTVMPPPDLSRSLSDRRVGGFGIHFVTQLMSEVACVGARDRNHLRLKRRWRR
jgi:anti-sigma regulatory factor (Ser/Thr protein kinase)